MSWHATKAAWRAAVKGGEKLVLLAIAFFVPPAPKKRHVPLYMTPALSLKELETMTGLKNRQLRDLRGRLRERGLIRWTDEDSHGRRASYEYVGMLGELWIVTAADAEALSREAAKNAASTRQSLPRPGPLRRQKLPPQAPDHLLVPTNCTSRSGGGEAADLALRGVVVDFLEWWVDTYSKYVGDGSAAYTFANGYEHDAARVLQLLAGTAVKKARSVERLKAMAIVALTIEPTADRQSDESYIARHRNIHVIHKKDQFLDSLVGQAAELPWSAIDCRHEEQCPHGPACRVKDLNPEKWPRLRSAATG